MDSIFSAVVISAITIPVVAALICILGIFLVFVARGFIRRMIR